MRPKTPCKINYCPPYFEFKPSGCNARDLEVIEITEAEAEALRLKNIKDLDQTEAARKMGISQSTFQRILTSAYKKVSTALLEGCAIKIITKENKQT